MNESILMLGGAGYIGSHTAYLLAQLGYHVILLDNLGHKQSLHCPWATLINADFGDESAIRTIFEQYTIAGVMHFAGFIEVGESVKNPRAFYENNVVNTVKFLGLMLDYQVKNLIFSSTCAIYGNPVKLPMDELHPLAPVSPYGKTKLTLEYILQDYAHAYGLKYVSLRYFNAAGALPGIGLGEQHKPETHLIPLLLRALDEQKPFNIFGDDYPTKDGTCVRDYIHVVDIAQAHILALDYLQRGGVSDAFNLGTGTGFTVKEVVQVAQEVAQRKAHVNLCPRRAGDAESLVADPRKIQKILGWQPEHSALHAIISSAYQWEQSIKEKKSSVALMM